MWPDEFLKMEKKAKTVVEVVLGDAAVEDDVTYLDVVAKSRFEFGFTEIDLVLFHLKVFILQSLTSVC